MIDLNESGKRKQFVTVENTAAIDRLILFLKFTKH